MTENFRYLIGRGMTITGVFLVIIFIPYLIFLKKCSLIGVVSVGMCIGMSLSIMFTMAIFLALGIATVEHNKRRRNRRV